MKNKSKLGMGIIIAIIVISLIVIAINYSNPEENFNKAITELGNIQKVNHENPSLVLFYSPRCSYCVQFMPIFDKLVKKYQDKYNVILINAEDPNYASFVMSNVSSLPSLYIVDEKTNNKVHICSTNYRSLAATEYEMVRYLKIRKAIDFNKIEK